MYDKKKLEEFLDRLRVEYHEQKPKIIQPRSKLDEKMDKYDLYKQGDWRNVGTPEMPIYVRPVPVDNDFIYSSMLGMMQKYIQGMWATAAPPPLSAAGMQYGGIARSPRSPQPGVMSSWYPEAPLYPRTPIETSHQRLKKQIAQAGEEQPVKIEDPEPPKPAPSPDYIGTLTAWRGWSVNDGILTALGTDYDWAPKRAARAKCEHHSHPAPQMQCSCGFWSFKTLDLLVEALRNYTSDTLVVGTVEIWGRVVECQNGFRSEFAYPKELWLLKGGMESLSWTYGVPVRQATKETK